MHSIGYRTRKSRQKAKYCSHASDLTILLSLFLSVDKCISIWDIKKMCQSSRTYHLLQQNNIITTMILLICTWNLKSHLFNNYQLSMFKWPLNGLGRLSITHGDSLTMVSFYWSYKIDNWMPKRALRQRKYIRQDYLSSQYLSIKPSPTLCIFRIQ